MKRLIIRIAFWCLAAFWVGISIPKIMDHAHRASLPRLVFFAAWMIVPALVIGGIGHVATIDTRPKDS